MKIYTRGGDEGDTSLFGGGRVGKQTLRIAAYGDVDELSCVLGWCAVAATDCDSLLRREQQRLQDLGAWLATPDEAQGRLAEKLPVWDEATCGTLESEMDQWDEKLPELRSFLLPGGCEASARLHIARAVCRRVERSVAALVAEQGSVDPAHRAYLNRLSDWLFVLARTVEQADGISER